MGCGTLFKLLALALTSTTSGHVIQSRQDASGSGGWCGSVATPEWLADAHSRAEGPHKRMVARQSAIVVDTYFHVVANSSRVQDGYLSVSFTNTYFHDTRKFHVKY